MWEHLTDIVKMIAASVPVGATIVGLLLTLHKLRSQNITDLGRQFERLNKDFRGLHIQLQTLNTDFENRYLSKDDHTAAVRTLDAGITRLDASLNRLDGRLYDLMRGTNRSGPPQQNGGLM